MESKQNVVCWFEIYVTYMKRAKKFYETVLDIRLEEAPTMEGMENMQMAYFPYEHGAPNANGALVKMDGMKALGEATVSTIVYFQSEDCAIEESRVAAAGGMVHKSKFKIGEHGFCAICLDTEGNTFGIHSMK